ncbi:DUF7673 family protein [Pseudomonas putida]
MTAKEKPRPAHKMEISDDVIISLKRLLAASTTGMLDAEPAAAFLLAWYEPETYGGFHISDLWQMDNQTRQAAATFFTWLSENHVTPDDLELGLVLKVISARWAV